MFATEGTADVGRLSSHISKPLTNLDDEEEDVKDEKSEHLTSSVISQAIPETETLRESREFLNNN